jgi:hypothetical protein
VSVWVTLPGGQTLSLAQAMTLARLIEGMGDEKSHWHPNDCGCCVALHGSDHAYVINRDGEETFYAERGCGCDD